MMHYKKFWIAIFCCTFIPFSGVFTQTLTLQQTIEEAIAHNPELLKADQDFKGAKAGVWIGISPEYPEFFMEFGGVPENHSWSDYRERKTGFIQKFEFPINYFFRGQWHQIEKERVYAKYNLLRNKLVSAVKKQFYKILLLRQKKQLYNDITRITQQNYQKAKIRVLSGESSPYDTLKVKVDLVEVENDVLALHEEYEITHAELNILIGRDRNDFIEFEGNLSYSPITLNPDSLHKIALAYHPHLREIEALVRQKKVKRNLSWTGLIPNFHVKYFNHDLPRESSPNAWGGEIGLSIPLWFPLKGQGIIRTASHNLEASRWQLIAEKRKVLLEVDRALSQLIVAEKQVQNYLESTLLEVEELVRIATRSYEEGEMGYLELAEALRTMNRVRAGYNDALYHYLEARANLEVALGIPFDLLK